MGALFDPQTHLVMAGQTSQNCENHGGEGGAGAGGGRFWTLETGHYEM